MNSIVVLHEVRYCGGVTPPNIWVCYISWTGLTATVKPPFVITEHQAISGKPAKLARRAAVG